MFDLHAVSIFATGTGESDTSEWTICLSKPRCYGDCMLLVKKPNVNSKNKQDPNLSRYFLKGENWSDTS
jgi:hypothetical protein